MFYLWIYWIGYFSVYVCCVWFHGNLIRYLAKNICEICKSMYNLSRTSGKNIVITYKSYRIILRESIRKIYKYNLKNRQSNLNPVSYVETWSFESSKQLFIINSWCKLFQHQALNWNYSSLCGFNNIDNTFKGIVVG